MEKYELEKQWNNQRYAQLTIEHRLSQERQKRSTYEGTHSQLDSQISNIQSNSMPNQSVLLSLSSLPVAPCAISVSLCNKAYPTSTPKIATTLTDSSGCLDCEATLHLEHTITNEMGTQSVGHSSRNVDLDYTLDSKGLERGGLNASWTHTYPQGSSD
ncbi:unnamed protein product [Protopolystoma xenopodis]|uniref:Uncharacterized protein n=1 Tax=Protopolystoma xenopodis TaxID=117903 RepID=A0A448XPI1_9PLAT|nr:unnamed protein product [Protopolystoma xenopodis]